MPVRPREATHMILICHMCGVEAVQSTSYKARALAQNSTQGQASAKKGWGRQGRAEREVLERVLNLFMYREYS